MTPEPPSKSQGSSLPPRHRPTLGEMSQDTTEGDLWAFEEELQDGGGAELPVATPRKRASDIPGPRADAALAASWEVIPMPTNEVVRINVNKPPVKSPPETSPAGPSAPESEFKDLDNWEDMSLEAEIGELPEEVTPDVVEETKPLDASPAAAPDLAVAAPVKAATTEAGAPSGKPDMAAAPPLLARPRFSRLEWIGMGGLLVLLLGVGASVFIGSIRGLPSETAKAKANDFPIEGRNFVIKSAINYWREPLTEGPGADTVRRGTRLLPVLETTVSGGPAAIRVLFRNGDREVVGDVITREVQGQEMLIIPATAGFDDIGMHAAYRTGGGKPWTIEVHEAVSMNSPGSDFRKVFEMIITTDRR